MKILLLFLMIPTVFASDWPQWSGDQRNHHDMTPERPVLSPANVKNMKVRWVTTVDSSIVDTPTVAEGKIYFNDIAKVAVEGIFTGGHLYSADAATGNILWKQKIDTYSGSAVRNFSRTSPAISGNRLVLGDSLNNIKFIVRLMVARKSIPGTSVIAVNRTTGKLLWKTIVEDHFASRITMSPVIHGNQVFVGVSSIESEIPAVKGELYQCCTFKGSFVSLDLTTGKLLWKTPMIAAGLEDSGAPVWGNSPPIDVKRNRIYIGSGNNYHATKAMMNCYMEGMKKDPKRETEITISCAQKHDSPENRFDTLSALDMKTGKIIWSVKTNIYDAWNVGCGSKFTNFPRRNERICPKPEGTDGDFAQAPMLLTISGKDILVAGQKNGMFWALDAETGKTIWSKQVGPGGKLGGHQWGSATDGKKVFFQTTNLEHNEIVINGKTIRGGYWGALDALTGEILWETPDPNTVFPLKGEGIDHWIYGKDLGRGYFAAPMGPLTYYNGLVFGGSFSGLMVAMDASSGEILWKHVTKGSVVTAPSIVNDQLFWGVGYHLGFQDDKLYSFGL